MTRPLFIVKLTKFILPALLVMPLLSCTHPGGPSTESDPDGEISLAIDDPKEQADAQKKVYQDMSEGLSKYTIVPGDIIEAVYLSSNNPQPYAYRLGVSDRIRIEFHYTGEEPRTLTIRPDGVITVPFKGDVMAAGLTPSELSNKLEEEYSDFFKNPLITVSVEKFTSRLDDLRVSLSSVQRGRSQKLVVSPDGIVYLPYLDGLKVSGKSIDEAKKIINANYREKYGNLEVSLLLDTVTGNRIFVFGEVASPGVIQPKGQYTVLQAVAAAGGHLPTGSLSEVRVAYWSDDEQQPKLRTVNLNRVMNEHRIEEDMVLPGNSTIYIPPTGITLADRAVDQYLRQLFLFNGTSIGLNYQVNTVKTR